MTAYIIFWLRPEPFSGATERTMSDDYYPYVVIIRDDRRSEDDPPGDYILATRQVFPDRKSAEAWAQGIARGREPLVVEGRWHQLRLP